MNQLEIVSCTEAGMAGAVIEKQGASPTGSSPQDQHGELCFDSPPFSQKVDDLNPSPCSSERDHRQLRTTSLSVLSSNSKGGVIEAKLEHGLPIPPKYTKCYISMLRVWEQMAVGDCLVVTGKKGLINSANNWGRNTGARFVYRTVGSNRYAIWKVKGQIAHGATSIRGGTRGCPIPEVTLLAVHDELASGSSPSEVCLKFGVSNCTVYKIRKGQYARLNRILERVGRNRATGAGAEPAVQIMPEPRKDS